MDKKPKLPRALAVTSISVPCQVYTSFADDVLKRSSSIATGLSASPASMRTCHGQAEENASECWGAQVGSSEGFLRRSIGGASCASLESLMHMMDI